MGPAMVLAREARRLNRTVGAPGLPCLYFFTDPARTPDPVATARRLPRGTVIVYRHFGAPDRQATARALARLCKRRGLKLLVAADPALARRVAADGVHWPETRARRSHGGGLQTMAVHSSAALARAAKLGMDAAVLSPVLLSRSASAGTPLGLFRASRWARAAKLPVIALGGVNARSARLFKGRGFSGLACVEGLETA